VFLQNGDKQIMVTNFPSERYDELNYSKGTKIFIYNLRKETTDFVYSATKMTMIYD
jgi:hypothetical protein